MSQSSIEFGGAPDRGCSAVELLGFRFVLLYVGFQLLPLDERFVRNLTAFGDGYTRYVFNLSKYAPHFFGPAATFADWGAVAGLAWVGAVIWIIQSRNTTADERLYYALRVAVRYRLALGVIAYGFIKLFPLQAPLPSISHLNTAYGDFTAWKLFSLTLGIVPSYQSFLGGVELLGGLLLLNRKTTSVGTLILLPFLGNVFFSNLAYEGGESVYCGLLLSFALFLFAHDSVRLFQLVSLGLPTGPERFRPAFGEPWQRAGQRALKRAFVLFVIVIYGFSTYAAYRKAPFRFPQTPGLPGVAGLYRVSEFRVNNQTVLYSKTHPTRWQDVVFETWNTLSIRSNAPVHLHYVGTEELPAGDANRDYELAGTQGRHYYRYVVEPGGHVLTLRNANPNHPGETLRLTVSNVGNGRIMLSGLTATRDSVYAVLDKVTKSYLLHEAAKAGRRGSLTL